MSSMIGMLGRPVRALVLGLASQAIITGLPSAALADSFNAKPGAWEITHTSQISGSIIPPDAFAAMPPEQRAKLEQSMQARAGKSKAHVTTSCVTKEDLDQNRIIKDETGEEESRCPTKVVSKSSTKLVLERICPEPHASTTHMTMETKTPESIVGSIDMARAGSGKMHVDIQGRWLSANCAGIKDRE